MRFSDNLVSNIFRGNPLSFKRRQTQPKPLSRFISHLYSPPKKPRQPRPTIQIPYSPDEHDLPELNETQDVNEQGLGKEVSGEWVAEGGIGGRKYDDLTAIGYTLWKNLCADTVCRLDS